MCGKPKGSLDVPTWTEGFKGDACTALRGGCLFSAARTPTLDNMHPSPANESSDTRPTLHGRRTESKTEIRQRIRRQRRHVGLRERTHAARRLVSVLRRSREYRSSRRIACYWAVDGEIELNAFLMRAHRDGRSLYLPVLSGKRSGYLQFHRYRPGECLRANRFGIPEPVARPSRRLACQQLDLVLLPLVAFDRQGQRLGMGAGFYDRTFAFLRQRGARWRRPRLLGVAFGFQQVAALPVEPWDVPLAGIATENGLLRGRAVRRPNAGKEIPIG